MTIVPCLMLAACASSSSTPRAKVAATVTATTLTCAVSKPVSAPEITSANLQTTVTVPGRPFASAASPSGQWIFVSLNSDSLGAGHIAVLQRSGSGDEMSQLSAVPSEPSGLALTHDGRLLIVAEYSNITVLNAARAGAGAPNTVLGSIATGPKAGTLQVAISPDDHYVFATNEYSQESMLVIDLRNALSNGFLPSATIGMVPLDYWPLGMASLLMAMRCTLRAMPARKPSPCMD